MSKEAFLSTSNVVKSLGGQGSALDPAGGAYSVPSDLAGGKGACCTLPNNPIRAVGPRTSCMAFGHSTRPKVQILNTPLLSL